MNLEDVRAFVAVAESGSLVAAARALGLPRSTLRRRVDELEAMVGTPLLLRTPSGVVATEAGRVLLRGARALLQDASSLLSRVRAAADDAASSLRVLIPHGLPKEALGMSYAVLHSAQPNLSLRVRLSPDPIVDLLDDVDLVIHFGFEFPPGPWLTYPLIPLRRRLLAAPSYLAAHAPVRTLGDLGAHSLLVWEQPRGNPREIPLCDGATWTASPAVVTPDITLLRQLACDGLGIAFVPDAEGVVGGDSTGELVAVLADVVGADCALRISVPAVLAELPKVRAVINMLALSARSAITPMSQG